MHGREPRETPVDRPGLLLVVSDRRFPQQFGAYPDTSGSREFLIMYEIEPSVSWTPIMISA
ncbi:hypothetical protein GCM10010518_54980 [Kitasatospora cinereorecta]